MVASPSISGEKWGRSLDQFVILVFWFFSPKEFLPGENTKYHFGVEDV